MAVDPNKSKKKSVQSSMRVQEDCNLQVSMKSGQNMKPIRSRGNSEKKHDRYSRTGRAPQINYGTEGRPAGEPEAFSDYNIIY